MVSTRGRAATRPHRSQKQFWCNWVSADQLVPSATPLQRMTGDQVKRRHVWVLGAGGYQRPGLVIAWRRTSDSSGWEAHVARAHGDGRALITWEPASHLRPVSDDGWQVEPKGPRR